MPNADSRRNADANGLGRVRRVNGQGACSEVGSIFAAADAESQGKLTWAVCQILNAASCRTPAPHASNAFERLERADQNAAGTALRFRDYVQAFIHAIDQVHVRMARLAEQHAGPRSNATPGMRRPILQSQVSFGFDDSARSCPVRQDGSQKGSCDLDRRPVIERARKRTGHAYINPGLHFDFAVEHHLLELEFVFDCSRSELADEFHIFVVGSKRGGLREEETHG